jgi:hypothetical protein
MNNRTCLVDGCTSTKIAARGWCSSHYMRWSRYGDVMYRVKGEVRDGCRICPWCKSDIRLIDYTAGSAYCRGCNASRKRARPLPAVIRNTPIFCVECATKFAPRKRSDICCSDDCSSRRRKRFMREDTLRYRALRKDAFIESVNAQAVLDRDGWICQLCDVPIDRMAVFPARLSPSVDHIIPLHIGGLHEYANCQAAHLSCNAGKGARIS